MGLCALFDWFLLLVGCFVLLWCLGLVVFGGCFVGLLLFWWGLVGWVVWVLGVLTCVLLIWFY